MSEATGPVGDPGERPDVGSAPWHRNPYVIAFVAGVITLTWLHFRLRHVPDAPPEFGTLVVEDWTTLDDEPLADPFEAPATLVAFVAAADGTDCGGPRLLTKVRARFADAGLDVPLAVVGVGAPGDAKAWARIDGNLGGAHDDLWFGGPSTPAGADALMASIDAAMTPWRTWRESNPGPRPPVQMEPAPACDGPEALSFVALVDGDGDIRGFFDAWGWEIESELFHRARHVLREAAGE